MSHLAPNQSECRRCHATWTGFAAAHCMSCHRTFTSDSGFDRHTCNMNPGDQVTKAGRKVFELSPRHGGSWQLAGRNPFGSTEAAHIEAHPLDAEAT